MSENIEGSFTSVFPNISTLTDLDKFSETHIIGNISWKIGVKQVTVDDVKKLGVYLWCNWENDSQMWKVEGTQTLALLSRKEGVAKVELSSSFSLNSKGCNWGWPSFMKWDDLMDSNKGYVTDDSIQISASVIIKNVVGIQSFGYNFHKSSSASDVVLVVEGQQLHVNKAYMSMVSPVLKTLLSGNYGYYNGLRYEVGNVKYAEFLTFLNAVHHIPSTIDESNVESLLKLAKRFEVVPVMYQCEQFLLSNKKITLTKKFLLADSYCLSVLHASCTKLLEIPNIEALKIDEGYSNLSVASRDALLESMLKIVKTMKEA